MHDMPFIGCIGFLIGLKMKSIAKLVLALLALALVPLKEADAQEIRFQGVAKASHSFIAWESFNTCSLSLGARLNEGNYLGIGSGGLWLTRVERDENHVPGAEYSVFHTPLYLDYIHYFNASGARRNSFFLGAEAGGALRSNVSFGQKLYYHGDIKWGFDFSICKNFGAYIGMDILAGYAYGVGINAGFRF